VVTQTAPNSRQLNTSGARPPKGKLLESFVHAGEGMRYILWSERNPRIYLAVTLVVAALGIWLHLTAGQWALIVSAVAVVFAGEMLNTVVECLVDLITLEHNPLAKTAKDVAAGAVLVASVAAAMVGLLILGPPLWAKLAALWG
jgi:diacylglycerol kinase